MNLPIVRGLKRLGGIVLAAVGMIFALSFLALLFRHAGFPWWSIVVGFVLLSVAPFSGAYFLLKDEIQAPSKSCPKCGAVERAPCLSLRKSRSFLPYYVFGWLLTALWKASKEEEFRCLSCETVYFSDSKSTRISSLALCVFVLMIVFGWVLVIVEK